MSVKKSFCILGATLASALFTSAAHAQIAASWTNVNGGALDGSSFTSSVTGGTAVTIQSGFASVFATESGYALPLTVTNYFDYNADAAVTLSLSLRGSRYLYTHFTGDQALIRSI